MSSFKGLQISLLVVLVGVMGLMPGCAKKPDQTRYVLTGNIILVNECDEKQASIPDEVKVLAWLNSNRPPNKIGGEQKVKLAPDPATPKASKKIGTYTVSVGWAGMDGKPSTWNQPTIKFDGREVCSNNKNCVEGKCIDHEKIDPIPATGATTKHDIYVHCLCKK